jgi:glycine/D-amino acid oxidase-like deaminating enzyme
MISTSIDHSHELAIAHFGHGEARRLARLGRDNVTTMLRFLEANGIACDAEQKGTIHFALNAAHAEHFPPSLECARSLGIDDLEIWSKARAQDEIKSPLYEGALFDPSGGTVDPVKLANGLAALATRAGVRIFEGSPVSSIAPHGDGILVRTPGGELRAGRVVLATNAYSHHLLPSLGWRFLPLYDYVTVSEPLTPAQRDRIGWKNRQGVTDVRAFFNYYRLTDDDRILWGTSEAMYHGDAGPAFDHSASHYASLRASFDRHFPDLHDLAFPYAWGGPISATARFTPFFGSALDGRLVYGLGYTGHGVATTHLAGEHLAHKALGRASPHDDLQMVTNPPMPYPPEPLRRWAIDAVTAALRKVDAGEEPGLLLRALDAMGIGLSS